MIYDWKNLPKVFRDEVRISKKRPSQKNLISIHVRCIYWYIMRVKMQKLVNISNLKKTTVDFLSENGFEFKRIDSEGSVDINQLVEFEETVGFGHHNSYNLGALHIAAKQRNEEAFFDLINHGANPLLESDFNTEPRRPYYYAIGNEILEGNKAIIRYLEPFEQKIREEAQNIAANKRALQQAERDESTRRQSSRKTRRLDVQINELSSEARDYLQKRFYQYDDINNYGSSNHQTYGVLTPIQWSIIDNKLEYVKELLSKGVEFEAIHDKYGNVVSIGEIVSEEMMAFLSSEETKDRFNHNKSALDKKIQSSPPLTIRNLHNEHLKQRLINLGFNQDNDLDFNFADFQGKDSYITSLTPMQYAADIGDAALIRSLHEAGVKLQVSNLIPPITYAAKNGYKAAVETLVELGAKEYDGLDILINRKRNELITTLFNFIYNHNLLAKGPKVDYDGTLNCLSQMDKKNTRPK